MPTKKGIQNKPYAYPWAAVVEFVVGPLCGVRDSESELPAPLAINDGWHVAQLESVEIDPELKRAGHRGFRLTVEAEDTACGAESIGVRLIYALLALAVEQKWGLTLVSQDTPLACRVVDRNAPKGPTLQAFATVTQYISKADFESKVRAGFQRYTEEVPYRLLLSMELFAASMLEEPSRSKLVMLVSALEALAEQGDLSHDLGQVVTKLLDVVRSSEVDDGLRKSLEG